MRRRPRAWPLVLLVFTMCPYISREELACEEAKAWLRDCCPGFTGRYLSCASDPWQESDGSSCDPPDLGEADARCVTGRTCAELVDGGTCAQASFSWDTGPGTAPFDARVCAP